MEIEQRIEQLNQDLSFHAEKISELLCRFNLDTGGQAVDLEFEHDWTPVIENGEPNGTWEPTKPKLMAKLKSVPLPPRKY